MRVERVEIVEIKVEAMCMTCKKCYIDEDDKECEKLLCLVDGSEVEDESDCALWELNPDLLDVCGFIVKETKS